MAKLVKPGQAVKVTLVSHTNDTLRTIAAAYLNMQGNMQHNLYNIGWEQSKEIFADICKTDIQGAFEFVHFFFQIEGVTRAFQQQLTRTRLAAYSAESLRFTDVTKKEMQVLAGPSIWEHSLTLQQNAYQEVVDRIEENYVFMVENGMSIEDARGILPLNVLSKIGMSVSYKTLIHMSRVRMCYQSQPGEWTYVFEAMIQNIKGKLGKSGELLASQFGPYCEFSLECPFNSSLDRQCERKIL